MPERWLFTVAHNEYRSHRRWQRVDPSRMLARHPPAETEPIDETSDGLRDLSRALSRLAVADREVLLLVAVEGFEAQEAAAVLGITYDALRQRLARARARLGDMLRANVA